MVQSNHTYFFRGQQDISWKLETSFQRYAAKASIDWKTYIYQIVPEVSRHSALFNNAISNLNDVVEVGNFLAKLQHHGFPTPLLDWTRSPYVAAYFALKDIDPHKTYSNEYVKVYMFDYQLWRSSFAQVSFLHTPTPFLSEFQPSLVNNQRLVSQMAVTTITNVPDVEQYLYGIQQSTGKQFLYYALLPIRERRTIMNELDLMGINSATMFPDFDGMCLSLREKMFNNVDPKQVILANPLPVPPPV